MIKPLLCPILYDDGQRVDIFAAADRRVDCLRSLALLSDRAMKFGSAGKARREI